MIPAGVKVFLASHPIDFRKGPDSLLSLVRDAGSDPFNGSLYVFRAKRADRIKIVWWDGSGVCLYAKRLEKAQFCWPRIGHNRVQLNHAQLDTSIYRIFYRRRDDLRPTAEFGGPFNVGISAFLLLSEPLRIMRRRVFLHGTRIGACCRRCWPCRSSPWPC